MGASIDAVAQTIVDGSLTDEQIAAILAADPNHFRLIFSRVNKLRIEPLGPPDDQAFCWWFVGLFDGEGSFALEKKGYNPTAQIAIRIDDLGMSVELLRRLGGTLLFTKKRGLENYPVCLWRIRSIQQLAKVLVPLFDQYGLRTKKRREYTYWRRLVLTRSEMLSRTRRRQGQAWLEYVSLFEENVEHFSRIRRPWLFETMANVAVTGGKL